MSAAAEGTRLAKLYREEVRADALADVLAETLDQWRREREPGEAFGDWAARAGGAGGLIHACRGATRRRPRGGSLCRRAIIVIGPEPAGAP
jgi:sulfite reductase beta subunit-like hemoprotein